VAEADALLLNATHAGLYFVCHKNGYGRKKILTDRKYGSVAEFVGDFRDISGFPEASS
jgi:hypothetical protein